MSEQKKLTNRNGAPVVDNQNTMTAGPRGPVLLQDVWYLEKLAHFDREVIPERRMHAKGSGASAPSPSLTTSPGTRGQ
jgi:catalase